MLTKREFEEIQNYLCELVDGDEKAQGILNSAGLSVGQMKIISTYIVAGIRAYDGLKSGSVFIKSDPKKIV